MVPMLDEKSATVIFANIEDILLCNTVSLLAARDIHKSRFQTFLSSLEERQKECRLYIDRIGDVLDAHMSGMVVYMVGLHICLVIPRSRAIAAILRAPSPCDQGAAGVAAEYPRAGYASTSESVSYLPHVCANPFPDAVAPAGRGPRHPEPGPIILSADSDAANYEVPALDEAGRPNACRGQG